MTAPPAQAPSLQELVENFAFLEDWPARYEYLLDLGKHLGGLRDVEKNDASRVHGCMSQVWLVLEYAPTTGVRVRADSDAFLVRGLLAVLQSAYEGLSLEAALKLDPAAILGEIGLQAHLSASRRNGLGAMIARIRTLLAAADQ